MSFAVLLAVCFFACALGPLCGIGGGVFIKPAIDALGLMDVSQASFLSSATVLAMSLFTMALRAGRRRSGREEAAGGAPHARAEHNGAAKPRGAFAEGALPVALGAGAGGIAGKALFAQARAGLSLSLVGAAQSAVLLALSLLSIAIMLGKGRLVRLRLTSRASQALLGVLSGAAWSFLGIGGGPFNLVLLTLFCGMTTGPASRASLLIIAFSQGAGLIYLLLTAAVPAFDPAGLAGMLAMAVAGSLAGLRLSARIDDARRGRLYVAALALIALVCAFNLARFLA